MNERIKELQQDAFNFVGELPLSELKRLRIQ
jgi:hypothetical protein